MNETKLVSHSVSQKPVCPICQGSVTRASLHQPYAYWRCYDCGTAHLRPQPSAEFLDAFYETFHGSADEGGFFADFESRTAADFPAKARIVLESLQGAICQEGEPRRTLDVGCGKGFFVREMAALGLMAEGIDASRAGVEAGRRLGIAGLHAGQLEQQTSWAGRFDAVTAWATIEHLPSPRAFLFAAHRVLKPGGLLFLDTGLAGDFVDRMAPGLVQWFDSPQHLFVFSAAALRRLLAEAGFSVLKVDPNFERSMARRIAKLARNRTLTFAGKCLFRLALGRRVFQQMRMETKLPFGSLVFVVARAEPM
jgi:SAM-dependent methyltransferase